jgi:hypothetical protein
VEISPGLRWLLWRAYGPPDEVLAGVEGLDDGTVTELARRFDLAARVGARAPSESLAAELERETLAWFRKRHAESAARILLAQPVWRELAEMGCQLDIPLVFLKGAALVLAGHTPTGSRNMGDVDVLAPKGETKRLQAALVDSGCAALEARESEHQLQYLTHRSGFGIEVHKIIPGVRINGESSATADQLIEKGLVHPAPGLGDDAYLPNDEVLFAHALVHGIAQHGLTPQGYPMARMLADVQDLGVDEPRLVELLDSGFKWISGDVSREEVEAVAGLVARLEVGEDPAAIASADDGTGIVLRHLVAGATDESYAHSLKFRSLRDRPREMGAARAAASTLQGALFLTRGQVDQLYGPPTTELGYWGWRLWRPFDLALRVARYGCAWIGQRVQRWRR